MNIYSDDKILKYNNKMASVAHSKYLYLIKKARNLWKKHGQKDDSGNLVMKSSKMSKIALNLQEKIDQANAEELKYLLSGRIVWQGMV